MVLFALRFVFGEDPAGVDLVDSDAVLSHQGIAEIAGHGRERALTDAVGEEIGLPAPGVDTADV